MKPFVLPFNSPDATLAVAGGKGANLSRMTRAGFPIPPGFLITTMAYSAFVQANNLHAKILALASDETKTVEDASTAIRQLFGRGHIPPEVAAAIQQAYAGLMQTTGDTLSLAVRSSATAEDLPDASFAGQQESYLNVRGKAALLEAVKRCWSSLWTERALDYRARQGIHPSSVSLAVVVQEMIPAEAAGILFTANPMNGARDEIVLDAAWGLGEAIVGGLVTPDHIVADKATGAIKQIAIGDKAVMTVPTATGTAEREVEGSKRHAQVLSAAQVAELVKLGAAIEAHYCAPQDIEWCTMNGAFYVVQTRPITTLPPEQRPVPVLAGPPPGFWQREASHYPRPLSPMLRIVQAAFNAGLRNMMSEFSLLAEAVEFREIGGWVYQRMVPLGGKDMPAPPVWLMPLLIRLIPQIRSRIKGAVEVVRSDKAGSYIRLWYAELKPELVADIARLRDVDLGMLSDEELDQHVAAMIAFLQRSLGIHTLVNGAVLVTLADIAFACRDLLDWDDQKTFDLFTGLSEKSSEPSRQLARLAQVARKRPAIRNLLEQIDDHTVERLANVDQDFAEAFAAYQREFGCRALSVEVADLTLAETPTLVLGLIRDQLVRGYDPAADAATLEQKRAAAIAEARTVLAGRSALDRERFERALARGEQAYPIREDNQFYAVSAPIGLMRYAALELGHRLAERGQIAQRDDVFFLELEEARAALHAGDDQHSLVADRKAERAWVETHPGPPSYGKDPGQPPSLAALPAEARYLMEAMLWATNRVFAAEHSGHGQAAGRALRGIAASPGVYDGTVRVIMNEFEFGRLQPGDVLVCPITSPVWSVLFPSVGALVTDTGGILSHSAIIAREYRVPAVVATGNATRLLRDGQNVIVDGNTGMVEIKS